MVKVLTPSTGEIREGGSLRLNILGFQPGDRALYRGEFGAWLIADVRAIGESGLILEKDGKLYANPSWREVAGIVAKGADETELLAELKRREQDGDLAVAQARKRKWDKVRVVLEKRRFLSRAAGFTPGE